MVDFTGGPLDTADQVEAVKSITSAWQAAGITTCAEVLAA